MSDHPDPAEHPTARDPPPRAAGPDADSLRTRESLLGRLKSWDDDASWREFFDMYWRLLYNFARRAGLGESDAQDLAQDALVNVAKQMPEFRYDRAKGRFKHWLLTIARRRIADHWRSSARARQTDSLDAGGTPPPELADEGLEPLWQEEWERHLLAAGMERLRKKASARHCLIFDLAAVRQTPARRVAEMLGVSVPQVWIIRHRLGRMLREEIRRLENGE